MTANLEFVRTIDPRVDINRRENKEFAILSCGGQQTWKIFPSTSFNNSQISWSCDPPNQGVYVNRRVYVTMKFQLNFTGVSAGPGVTLLQAPGMATSPGVSNGTVAYDAPRCHPLSACFNTFSVQMNNDNNSTNLGSYSRIMQRVSYSNDEFSHDLSMSPGFPDQTQNYNDAVGFMMNPLGGDLDNPDSPRGTFYGCTITSNTSTGVADTATVLLTVTEPIWLSPFSSGRNQEEVAFIGIQNLQLQATIGGRGNGPLSGLSGALWSHAPAGSNITGCVTNVLGGDVLFNYITPSRDQSLPDTVVYGYADPTLYATNSAVPIAPGATTQLVMNNVNLPGIPNRIYVYAAEQDQNVNMTVPDTYMNIENINITFGNVDGLLSNMQPVDLHQMHMRNGGNCSWNQWNSRVGSVLPISMGLDIPLDMDQAPGLRISQNISMIVRVRNISDRPIIPTLNVLAIQEGTMVISNGIVVRSTGMLTQGDVLDSKSQPARSHEIPKNFYGGAFWDSLKSLSRVIRPLAVKAANVLAPAHLRPAINVASKLAERYGYGLGMGQRKGPRGGELMALEDLSY